jgi:xylulokinase
MSALLGIDVGTTGTKALLLDAETGVIAEAERTTQLHSLHPGWAEEDTAEWWANVCATTRELVGSAGVAVAGVGVTGMVPCTILLDERGEPLRWSIQQNDARSGEQVARLNERLAGANVLQRTGSAITQQSTGPRFLWLAEHEPEIWAQTRTVLGSYDYVTMRLCGSRTVEANWALETGLLDFAAMDWADDVLEACGGRRELLPPIHRCHEVVGAVTAHAARETGLREGVPVVAGTADHIGSTFASGVLEDGDLLVKLGGAGDIMLAVDDPFVDDRLYLDFHLLPERFVLSGCMATSGSLIKWFQRELADGVSLAQLDAQAALVPPGAGGVVCLPYFLGEKTPINDPQATGAFIGLQLTHGRGHLFRALMEGVAFGFRHHIDVFAERGHRPLRARVTDGGSRSRVWTQITADVIGLPLEKVTMRSGSAFAAAFCAGMGVGAFTSWRDIDRFVAVDEVVEPRHHHVYDRNYRAYRELYPALKGVLV